MKKVILASLLATMMSTSPVWATDSATAAPAAAATTQVKYADAFWCMQLVAGE